LQTVPDFVRPRIPWYSTTTANTGGVETISVTNTLAGNPRSISPLPNLGADERWMYIYPPIILRN
jgi:hypothetical protein